MQTTNPLQKDYFRVCEVSDGRFFAGEIFKVKFGGVLPDYGRHIVALYKNGMTLVPLGYLNILEHEGIALVGGGCVYGKSFQNVSPEHCMEIRASGGVLFCMLRYVFLTMAEDYQAFFGYCGDRRAEEVDLQAGFRHTKYPNLLAFFHKYISDIDKCKITENVYQLGPF